MDTFCRESQKAGLFELIDLILSELTQSLESNLLSILERCNGFSGRHPWLVDMTVTFTNPQLVFILNSTELALVFCTQPALYPGPKAVLTARPLFIHFLMWLCVPRDIILYLSLAPASVTRPDNCWKYTVDGDVWGILPSTKLAAKAKSKHVQAKCRYMRVHSIFFAILDNSLQKKEAAITFFRGS